MLANFCIMKPLSKLVASHTFRYKFKYEESKINTRYKKGLISSWLTWIPLWVQTYKHNDEVQNLENDGSFTWKKIYDTQLPEKGRKQVTEFVHNL